MAATIVTEKKAVKLLDRLSAIAKEIDQLATEKELLAKQLKSIKDYDFESKGTFVTKSGSVLTVTERNGNEIPPDPQTIMDLLKKFKKGARFIDVVQVVPKKLREILGDDALKGVIKRKAATYAWSFSKE